MTSDVFVCPLSKENYKGACKITKCWANVADKHASGCFYHAVNGKTEIGVADLAYVLKQSRSDIQGQLGIAKDLVKSGLELLDQIEDVQVGSKRQACPQCGRAKATKGACLNKLKCTARKETIDWCLSHPLFGNLERPLSHTEFSQLLLNAHNIDRIAQLLKLTPEYREVLCELARSQAT